MFSAGSGLLDGSVFGLWWRPIGGLLFIFGSEDSV